MYLLYLGKFHITACAFSKSFSPQKFHTVWTVTLDSPHFQSFHEVFQILPILLRLYVLYLYLIFSRSKISLIALNYIMSVPIHKLSEFNIVSILFSFHAISNFIKLDLPPSFAAYRSLFQPVN